MSGTRFIIIDFPTITIEQSLKINNTVFFDILTSTLNNILNCEITSENQIIITLNHNDLPSYLTINEVEIDYTKNYQMLIEYNNVSRKILAIHDYYFSQTSKKNSYRVCMEDLYIHTGKYTNENPINHRRLVHSIVYGVLTDIALHNPGNLDVYTKGILLADYLNKFPPKETYKITKKIPNTAEDLVFSRLSGNKHIINKIKHYITPIPQINFDDFDKEEMLNIMRNCGSFEITGPQIDKLANLASQTLDTSKEIFNLPEVTLKSTEDPNDFNGYKNILEQTRETVSKEKKGTILHQQGFFYKPYNPITPTKIDVSALDIYYHQGLAILQCLYRQIALSLKINVDNLSSYQDDKQSVLSLKHYPAMNQGETGIQEHSDYSLLTLIVSDQQGLEIKNGKEWIAAPHQPKLRFYVNVGDWLLFQLNNSSFKPGIHRVLTLEKERYSAIIFYLPPLDEKRKTPNGKMTVYRDFLFSDKSAYISNSENVVNADPTSTPVIKQRI